MNGDMETMSARLQRVEHRLRVVSIGWLMSIVVFGVLAIGVQLAMSQQPGLQPVQSQDNVIRTRGVEVVDAAGNVRIALAVTPDGIAEIALSEAYGEGRIWLGAAPDGSSNLLLLDSGGRVVFQAR